MARIRSLHPEQWTDDAFVTCSSLARLLALGLRNFSDDNGVFRWNPVRLKMQILPADSCDVAELLGELVATGQVLYYEDEGRGYGIIRNFTTYQSPRRPSFSYPVPAPLPEGYVLHKDYSPSDAGEVTEDSRTTTDTSHTPAAGGEGSGEEGSGSGGEEPPRAPTRETAPDEPTFINLPLAGDGKPFAVTEPMVARYEELYPFLDVRQCLRDMAAWLEANPAKRKTRNGVKRFITGWIKRAQDKGECRKGGGSPGGGGSPPRSFGGEDYEGQL